MGFALDYIGELIVEPPHAGVVPQHRHHPILVPGNLPGGRLDADLEGVVQGEGLAGGLIPVEEPPPEGVVVAVVAPGLGQVLQFHIGGGGQPHRGPPGQDLRALKIIEDDRQVGIP